MLTFTQQLFIFLVVTLLFSIQPSMEDQSKSSISALGWKFVPIDSSLSPIFTYTTNKLLYCSAQCNQRIDCRTFDFDSSSGQCRLWDADTTTGSIVASPSKPQSIVGTIELSPSIYANIYNQSCDKCVESRYVTCNANSSTCQPNCDFTYRCSAPPAIGAGQTVAGFCNATIGNGSSDMSGPWGIYVSPFDGTLYLADWDLKRFQSFSPYSRTGQTIFSGGLNQPMDVFVDNSDLIYMTDDTLYGGIVYVQQNGIIVKSYPTVGLSTNSCLFTGLYSSYGIAVDRSGNIYTALFLCFMVVKWAPNATNGTLIAGQPRISGSTNNTLGRPRFLYLDENQDALYVTDYQNSRIQKFIIGGNGEGITVAGNTTVGTGLNQLNSPGGIWVTQDGQTLYVADDLNNRVMKWTIGATQGSVVAGSASGVPGSTAQLLNQPGDVALDPTETYLYVSDYGNHRIQRYRIR